LSPFSLFLGRTNYLWPYELLGIPIQIFPSQEAFSLKSHSIVNSSAVSLHYDAQLNAEGVGSLHVMLELILCFINLSHAKEN
jgi:hypothetical protein